MSNKKFCLLKKGLFIYWANAPGGVKVALWKSSIELVKQSGNCLS